jgi:hypothetical protein
MLLVGQSFSPTSHRLSGKSVAWVRLPGMAKLGRGMAAAAVAVVEGP